MLCPAEQTTPQAPAKNTFLTQQFLHNNTMPGIDLWKSTQYLPRDYCWCKLICCMSVLAPGIWISIFSHMSSRSQLWQRGQELNDRLFHLSPTARDMGILAHRSLFSESQSTNDWKRLWHTAFLMLLVRHVLKTWLRAPGSLSLSVCHWNQQL